VRRLLGLPYRDPQCGAKVLRREVIALVHLTVLSFGVAPALRAARRPVAAAQHDRTEGLKAA
jgi:hypothetical protein